MDKIAIFKEAVQNISRYAYNQEMSTPKNWCIVHATKYMPLQHKDGTRYIPSTAMATNFELPRATVHVTFNHVVTSHMMGSWDDMPIVVLAPYLDTAKENGNPAQISAVDTYWSVDPNRGFVLPENAYIIQPSDDILYNIGEHGATYKRDNYTDEEIQTILDLLPPEDRETYEKYSRGEFKDYEIEHEFHADKRVKKLYDSAKDKTAFLRGLFEENRFNILSHYLRNIVVRMAMSKNGFHELSDVYDGSTSCQIIADTAYEMGIPSTASNKGHSNSYYGEMEHYWGSIKPVLYGAFDEYGCLNAPDLEQLFNHISSHMNNRFIPDIVQSILAKKPLDFMKMYENYFLILIKDSIGWINIGIETRNKEILDIEKYQISDTEKEQRKAEQLQGIQELQHQIKKLSSIKTIADYDKNLSKALKNNAHLLSKEYKQWLFGLQKMPGYEKFIQKLKNLVAFENAKQSINYTRS